jgi:hypothetical protein
LVYTGFIVNPLDGHSYLAKMRQGAEGRWLFTLPFTSEPHSGALVFLYYLFLGHLSAWLGLPDLVVYHAARSLAGVALLLVAYHFLAKFVAGAAARRLGFVLIALSSGVGWLLAPTGVVSPDLWVPESNTFYSIFANPHFPLSEMLMLVVFLAVAAPFEWASAPDSGGVGRTLLAAGAAVTLAIVQPFPVVTVYGVLGVYLIACGVLAHNWPRAVWGRAIVSGLAALPVVAYDVAIYGRGAFAAWSVQNQTPSPSVGLLLATYGVLWAFAVIGAVQAVRTRRGVILMVWTAVTVAGLYAPFALQRRLMIGLHLPVAILAVVGLTQVVWPRLGRRRVWSTAATLALAVPSTIVLLVVGVVGPAQHEWPLFTSTDVWSAMTYLRGQNAPDDVVLAAPETSLFIPAWAGNRVIYGHPFETIDAARKRAAVEDALHGRSDVADLVRQYGVRYVFVGPLERDYGLARGTSAAQLAARWTAVYSNAEVTIYRVGPGG